jgi:filamentous hemagglutinin family protein
MEAIFTPYSKDFIFEEVQKRSFEISTISDSWSNLISQNIISLQNENKYMLNRNVLDYDESESNKSNESDSLDLCKKKIIELMKRDINDVYYSIMLECQKTKTFQMINQIFKILGINLFSKELLTTNNNKKVFFLVSQNMQDLTSQNCERILNDLGTYLQIFVFTSQYERKSKNKSIIYNAKIDEIFSYISSYLNGESSKIPMAIFLANPSQLTKMNNLLEFVEQENNHIYQINQENVQSYIFFDEADQTYPLAREILIKSIFDNSVYETFKVIRPLKSINKVYWISATQEEMVLTYPECAISKQALIQFQNGVMENHYSILDETAILHTCIQPKDMEHNDYILQIVQNNRSHFFDKMSNNSYRKIIGMSNVDNNKQKDLARTLNSMGANVILLNQSGIFLYRKDCETPISEELVSEELVSQELVSQELISQETVSEELVSQETVSEEGIKLDDVQIKSRNALIAKMYNETYVELQNAPLFILGNRKVDRGLTFHYAPIAEDSYSFILTDLIMGRIPNWKRAVQAIGRGNGVIKHHRDFIGSLDYWVDPITIENVKRHCKMMSDPLLISSDPSFSVSEIVKILNEKYPDPNEEIVNKRGSRNKYVYNFSESYNSFNELCEMLSKKYVNEKFRKTFVMVNGFYISTRLKKIFNVSKKEELNENHICTKIMLDSIQWNKILYGADMNYIIIPYYEAENVQNKKVQWVAIMKDKNNIDIVKDNIENVENITISNIVD